MSQKKIFHTSIILVLVCLFGLSFAPQASRAEAVDPWDQVTRLKKNSFPWQTSMREVGFKSIHICGDRNIIPTRTSMRKSFLVGPEKTGYLLTGLFTRSRYYQILTENNLDAAKEKLKDELAVVRLWKVGPDNTVQSFGAPKNIKLPFTATIKDCVEGARTTLGNNCSGTPKENRVPCCREKFAGPVIQWGEDLSYQLLYSPDPSVGLLLPKGPGRYCNVSTRIEI